MAGMFYSLQEVAQKLKKSEDEIKEMVKAGKLREFRDGTNLLFKVDEVEAIVKQGAEVDLEELILADTGNPATGRKEDKTPSKSEKKPDESIFLAEDTTGSKADLINADTALISEGLGLAETAGGEDKLDDIMEATKSGSGKPSGDLNLDSFGSGGLLDLSLQADDTSLGGILDEIYTAESSGGTPAGKPAPSVEEAISSGEILEAPKLAPETTAFMPVAIEIKPDAFCNALGIALFIPLVATIFTIIIAATGFSLPSILRAKSNMFGIYMGWIIMAGLAVIVLLIIGGGALVGGLGTKGEAKPKEKKEKSPKPPKEKKSKKK